MSAFVRALGAFTAIAAGIVGWVAFSIARDPVIGVAAVAIGVAALVLLAASTVT